MKREFEFPLVGGRTLILSNWALIRGGKIEILPINDTDRQDFNPMPVIMSLRFRA